MDIRDTNGTATPASGRRIGGEDQVRLRMGWMKALAAAAGVVVALSGCGGDASDAAVKAAQAKVSAAEEALWQAESDAAVAGAAFCSASSDYSMALDRYQTAATVGDVRGCRSGLDGSPPGDAGRGPGSRGRSGLGR